MKGTSILGSAWRQSVVARRRKASAREDGGGRLS
jgi:hypothetical protein